MLRQTALAILAVCGTLVHVRDAASKPVTFECELDRKIILSGKVRSQERVAETVTLDAVEKKLRVGEKSGTYVTAKLNEASMLGLPPRQKISFDMRDNTLSTFEASEFGEIVSRNGKCAVRGK